MTDYLVTLNDPGSFRIGVDYEIPSKSIQNANVILDDFSSQFDGITQTFSLFSNSESYFPVNDQQLIVVKNNLVLEPIQEYTISGDNIIFSIPPVLGDDVFIIALATTADLTRTINYVVDSGSFMMISGNKGSVTLDVSGIIESMTILSDQQGDLILDIKKSNYTNFPNFTSIVGGIFPKLENSRKMRDDDLDGWDTTLIAGDILTFDVIAVNNINRFLISLKLKL